MPGKSGSPGMHDKPGSPRETGRDGCDGRDGAKGDKGSPGNVKPQGPPGTPCIKEKNGTKVNLGLRALPAQRGSAARVKQVEYLELQV